MSPIAFRCSSHDSRNTVAPQIALLNKKIQKEDAKIQKIQKQIDDEYDDRHKADEKKVRMQVKIQQAQEEVERWTQEVHESTEPMAQMEEAEKALRERKGRIIEKLNGFKMQKSSLEKKQRPLTSQLRTMNDASKRQEMQLQQHFNDEYRMVQFINANQNRLKGAVEGPLFQIINVNDDATGTRLEKTLRSDQLKAFVVQHKEDAQLLREASDNHGRIQCSLVELPENYSYPQFDRPDLSEYGVESWLIDSVDNAPNKQLGLMGLLTFARVDQIPILGSDEVDLVEL
eukprot:TRINITY_DN2458_c2_g1_i1.p1 TRINITY_DN2458_c2_g1~~TRINITY_DN2458_c2_g1_i1.p1  ORF type:complete len:287 (-),score=93.58 TRINITY_DN2458_c2_g1_i1:152-1012(-)